MFGFVFLSNRIYFPFQCTVMYISHVCRERIATQKWNMNDILLSYIIMVLKIICLFRLLSSQTAIQEPANLTTTNNYRQNISEIVFKGWSLRQVLFPVMSEETLIQSKSSNEQKLIWYLAVAKEKLLSSLTLYFVLLFLFVQKDFVVFHTSSSKR